MLSQNIAIPSPCFPTISVTGLQLYAWIILRTVLQHGITLYFISMQKMQPNQILIPESHFGHVAVNCCKTQKVFVQSFIALMDSVRVRKDNAE